MLGVIVLEFLGLDPHRFQQGIIDVRLAAEPEDQSLIRAAAVKFHPVGDPVVGPQGGAQVHILLRLILGLGDHHRLHGIDLPQLLPGILQLQLQLFHIQPLPLQSQVA